MMPRSWSNHCEKRLAPRIHDDDQRLPECSDASANEMEQDFEQELTKKFADNFEYRLDQRANHLPVK